MDEYFVAIFSEGGNQSGIKLCMPHKQEEQKLSAPYLEWLLQTRKSNRYVISFKVSSNPVKLKAKTLTWNKLKHEDAELLEKNGQTATYGQVADILFELLEKIPAPGSVLLNVFWVTKNFDAQDSIKTVSPLLGVLRKLCAWNKGKLTVFLNAEPTERTMSVIDFVDAASDIVVKKEGKNIVVPSNAMMWQGSLDILSQGTPLMSLPGFTLLLNKSKITPEIVVTHTGGEASANSVENDSFTEDKKEHAWFDPCINLLEYIDVTTVPLYYFTGRKFLLHYNHNKRFPQQLAQVEHLRDMLRACDMSGFFCSMYYAYSKTPFDPVPEYSAKKWKDAVKARKDLSAPKFKFRHKVLTHHFVVMEAQDHEKVPVAEDEVVVQFVAYLFHAQEHMNFSLLHESLRKRSKTKGPDEPPDTHVTLDQLEGLPELNPCNLLYKDENFNQRFTDAIKKRSSSSDENDVIQMPLTELRKLAVDVSMQLNVEHEKALHDFTNAPSWFWREPLQHERIDDEKMHQMQIQALKNMRIAKEKEEEKLRATKPMESMRNAKRSSKPAIDMHMKPFDVLKHFSASGEPKNAEPFKTKPSEYGPSPRKLQDFDEAMKLSYHGITYNIDERAAEKQDRMCRRLVERQVKFETSSIGSSEKVPSPATMNIADSPVRRSSLAGDGKSTAGMEKRKQLKKVAEKLYKKRVQSRTSVSSERPHPTTSMVLRSTPTKASGTLSRRASSMSLRSMSTSENDRLMGRRLKSLSQIPSTKADSSEEEEKRMRRRTYVQDNKKRLNEIIAQSLVEQGVEQGSKQFAACSKRLYNVSMAFLKELKTSKDLDKIMKETVSNNVVSVISFNPK